MASLSDTDHPASPTAAGASTIEVPPGGLPTAVERLIERFGGIRPMADKLDVPVSTVQGWKKRNAIPSAREGILRTAAQRHGIALALTDFDGVFRAEDRAGDGSAQDAAGEAAVEAPAASAPAAAGAPSQAAAEAPSQAPSQAKGPARPERRLLDDAPSPVSALAHAYVHGLPEGSVVHVHQSVRGNSAAAATAAAFMALLGAAVAVTAPVWSTDVIEEFFANPTVSAGLASVTGSESKPGGATVVTRVAGLEKMLGTLEKQVANLPSATVSSAMAINQLRNSLVLAQPYQVELAAVLASRALDEESRRLLEPLGALSVTGVPTRKTLETRFDRLVPELVRVDLDGGRPGFGERMMGWMGGLGALLHLPGTGGPENLKTTSGLVFSAREMLDRGDLPQAIEAAAAVTGPAASVVQPWLNEARARIVADQAVAALGRRITVLLPATLTLPARP
jgi:hypothetical protein